MKKFSLFLTLSAVLFIFSSCDKEDDFSILGTWEQEKMELIVDFGIPLMEDYIQTFTDPSTATFNEDGTGSITSQEDGQNVTVPFSWTLSNNNLTLSGTGIDFSLNLTTKTNSKIVGEQILEIEELLALFEFPAEYESLLNAATTKLVLTLTK